MGGLIIKEDLLVKYNAIDKNTPKGQVIHNFLFGRAKQLASKYIDFEETPITFLLADIDAPNAFYAPPVNQLDIKRRDDYTDFRYTINPYNTAVICITRGLIEMFESLDELDYILGHELTHKIFRRYINGTNTKGEEAIADLHAVDMVYDAGSDPKEALRIEAKLKRYREETREKEGNRRRTTGEDDGLVWSEIFDVHMTGTNIETSLEASLTRLSHLIDDRTPTSLDKSIFDVKYSDPIDVFLRERGYEDQKAVGKLKTLVDCLEHISSKVPATEYLQAKLDALPEIDPDSFIDPYEHERESIQDEIDSDHENYFVGKTIDKKYQQKVAWLAESVFSEVSEKRREKGNPQKPAQINTRDIKVYLQNRAYEHIKKNGYPETSDLNYSDATGIVYSYFFALFSRPVYNNRGQLQENSKTSTPHIIADIDSARQKIYHASTFKEFKQATKEFEGLKAIHSQLKSISRNGMENMKLDNLSSVGSHYASHYESIEIYPEPSDVSKSNAVPWDNLVKIAKESKEAKKHIVRFLAEKRIEDFRITRNKPFIRMNRYTCLKVTKNKKKTTVERVPDYQLEYAINPDLVLRAYGYIKEYFKNEKALFEQARDDLLQLNHTDFTTFEHNGDRFNNNSAANKKIANFTLLYNSLPDTSRHKKSVGHKDKYVTSLINKRYLGKNPMPGTKENGDPEISESFFHPDNPIFIEHFGKGYRNSVIKEKNTQKQKMFGTVLETLDRSVDAWIKVSADLSNINREIDKLQDEVWELGGKTLEEKEKKQKEQKLQKLRRQAEPLKSKKELLGDTINNFLASALNHREEYQLRLSRLNKKQKSILADYAIKDETGALHKLLYPIRYTALYDFNGVLSKQVQKVIEGRDRLTKRMKLVMKNTGYQAAKTKEDFKNFAEKHSRDWQEISKYQSYLNVFDLLKYLAKSPEIDVYVLARSISALEVRQPDSYQEEILRDEEAAYKNYRDLIIESNLLDLISRAIDFKKNYTALTANELVETVDDLIDLRNKLDQLLVKRKHNGYEEKIIVAPKHEKFLNLIDKNIRGLLRRAQHQLLQSDDSLLKITELYKLYNKGGGRFSSSVRRRGYLDQIDEKEQSIRAIFDRSKEPDFWPNDPLNHVKAFVFARNTFLDDIELEDKILNQILDKLKGLGSGKQKNEALFILLDKNLRASYPKTRQRLFDIFTKDLIGKIGKDDRTEKYQKRLKLYLDALNSKEKKSWDKDDLLSNSISSADKYNLLRQIADEIISQEETSSMIKKASSANLNSEDMLKSYLYGIGIDYLTSEMDRDPNSANKFIQFLNSTGEMAECRDMSAYIEQTARKRVKEEGYAHTQLDKILENTQPTNCKVLYDNFWSAPIEARAVIISRILKSAVDSEERTPSQKSWERVFDLVMENVITTDDNSTEAQYARDIMHSYIKARSGYERELILSAMMVANRNIGKDTGNIGKAMKFFLENMGPAEIKLGQAIASHPDTPEGIQIELQYLKNDADKPARWTLYDWIKSENIPEEFWKEEYLGEILGSASYYTTVALGDKEVLRILRPEAREKAKKGFKVLGKTIEDLEQKSHTSQLDYKELTASTSEMIKQADKMSRIETDHIIGQKQYELTQKVYNSVQLKSDKETFTLKVMDWNAKGKNWVKMDRANGFIFNKLPEQTAEQREYKKAVAKAYIVFEISNILSGGKFDHDKHGAQLCIDPETNEIGIFDTGAMALRDPTNEEQKQLGHVIYDTMKQAIYEEKSFMDIGPILRNKIKELHTNQIDTQYLVEVQKGILALRDFFKVLSEKETADLIASMNIYSILSEQTKLGISEKMSLIEKAQLQTLTITNKHQKKDGVIITRIEPARIESNVVTIDLAPTIQPKSGWIEDLIESKDITAADQSDDEPAPLLLRQELRQAYQFTMTS